MRRAGTCCFTLNPAERDTDALVRHIDDLREVMGKIKAALRLRSWRWWCCPNTGTHASRGAWQPGLGRVVRMSGDPGRLSCYLGL